jgi:arginine/glutamate-rich protein 1
MEIEIKRRVEEAVSKRMTEEMARREPEIELEVQKRLLEAKRLMEKNLSEDFERQRQAEFKRILDKEVKHCFIERIKINLKTKVNICKKKHTPAIF